MTENEYLELRQTIKEYEMYLETQRIGLTGVEFEVACLQDDPECWEFA